MPKITTYLLIALIFLGIGIVIGLTLPREAVPDKPEGVFKQLFIEKGIIHQGNSIEALSAHFEPEGQTIKVEVTAYSEKDSCHYENCEMASGNPAYIGAIACPRNIKLGTVVKINDRYYICEDRMSEKFPERFDLFMGYGEEAYKKSIEFGKKQLTIIIYE